MDKIESTVHLSVIIHLVKNFLRSQNFQYSEWCLSIYITSLAQGKIPRATAGSGQSRLTAATFVIDDDHTKRNMP